MASRYQRKTNTHHQIHKSIEYALSPSARNNIDETKSAESAGQSDERVHHNQHDASANGKSTKMPKLSFKQKKDAVEKGSKQMTTTLTAQSWRPLSADQASKRSPLIRANNITGRAIQRRRTKISTNQIQFCNSTVILQQISRSKAS